jgi:hypothetical protein
VRDGVRRAGVSAARTDAMRRSRIGVTAVALALAVAPIGRPASRAANANMSAVDFGQPGQFSVQVPWRLGPDATSCPVVVHAFFGYTWFLQEQIDLVVEGIDFEVNGQPVSLGGGRHGFTMPAGETVVRKAGSGRRWWYRIFELPIDRFPEDATSTVRVRIHRSGRAAGPLPVPPAYRSFPDMRVTSGDSPYAEQPGWFRFAVHRSRHPLPSFPGFFGGDVHVHTEYTRSVAEFGGPLEVYARAAKAIGLDWATFTDHGSSLDSAENLADFNAGSTYPPFGPREETALDAKWRDLVTRTIALRQLPGRPFLGIVGTEVDVRPPARQGHHDDYFCHLLVYGHARPIPAEGANGLDWRVAGITLKRGEKGMSGTGDVYGADTPRLGSLLEDLSAGRFGALYGPSHLVAYLAHPINKQARFRPNPFHMGVWWRWGYDDDPDELPAFYAPADGRLPVTGFQVWNGNTAPYPEEVDPSIPYWDAILAEGLRMRPVRRNAISGGTDAHGDLNSTAVRDSVVALAALRFTRKPDGDGFGSVRTLAACPGALSEEAVLAALRDGRTVVTNGPALLAGVDRDGDGALAPGRDALPSVRAGDELEIEAATLPVLLAWRSTPEFGPVDEVRLVAGRSTGPKVVWSVRPAPGIAAGMDGRAAVELDAAALPEWSYLRAECTTRAGRDTVLGGRLLRRIERRAYTNPVWVHRRAAPGAGS